MKLEYKSDLESINAILKSLSDQLLYTADYLYEHGVISQEEAKLLDIVRQMVAEKIIETIK